MSEPVADALSRAGLRCARHPEVEAVAACTRCGSFFCEQCRGWEHGQERYCSACDPGGPYVPWEDRKRLGTTQAFLKTLKGLLLSPDRFFLRMPSTGGWGAPLVFAWFSWALASIVTSAAYGVLLGGLFAIMPMPAGESEPLGPVLVGTILGITGATLVGIVPALLLWSLALHVLAKLFGGEGTLQASFRCHAYASGVFALGIIPLMGMSVAQIYWVVLQIFALKHAHRMSTGRAAAAVLVLPAVCCGLYFVSLFALGALGGAATAR